MKLHLFRDANIEGFIILLKDTVFGLLEALTQSSFTKENRTEWCWWLWQLAKQWMGSRDKPKEIHDSGEVRRASAEGIIKD